MRGSSFGLALFAAGYFLARALFPTGPSLAVSPTPNTPGSQVDEAIARLDAALERRWQAAGARPANPAEPLTVVRRLTLVLAGTIPSLAEIRAFEARNPAEAVRWWRDTLLADRRHHDYFAERFARGYVGTHIEPPNVFRRDIFVDWISRQLAADRPYDEWVREMIAATGIWTEAPAANYLTATCDFNTYEGPDKIQLAGRTAQAFLGVNLECAECHDHPFEQWTRDDFRGLAAFFANTRRTSYGGLRDLERLPTDLSPAPKRAAMLGPVDKTAKNGSMAAPVPATDIVLNPSLQGPLPVTAPAPGNGAPDRDAAPRVLFAATLLPAEGTERERLAAWITAPDNRAFARTLVNRVWTLLMGESLVGTVANVPVAGPFPEELELLVDDFVEHGRSVRRLCQVITGSRVFLLDSRARDESRGSSNEKTNWTAYPVTRFRPEQEASAVLQVGHLDPYGAGTLFPARVRDAIGHLRFREQFGDLGEKEHSDSSASVTQKLLLMNGDLVTRNTSSSPLAASSLVALFAPDDASAIEIAYLATLTRRPTPPESDHFTQRLAGKTGPARIEAMADLYWSLVNSAEFSWNH